MRVSMRSTLGLLALSMLPAGFGCGGPSTGGGGTTPVNAATTEGGQVIRTDDGRAVSAEAHDRWQQGVAAFAAAEESSWNEARCEAAIDHFEEAIDAQGGGFAEAHYMAGLTAERCGDADEARTRYNRALQANQALCGARVALGLLDLKAGRRDQARAAFDRSIVDDPQCTSGYVNVAMMQRRQGADHVADALSNLRRGLAIESDYMPAFNEMALLHLQRARIARGREERQAALDLAEVVCRQAQLIDREYAPIYNTWGLIKMRKGDIIEALRFFERAVALDDDMFEAHMNFGEITLSFRGYEDAHRSFGRAVALRGRSYDALIGLGAALRGLERYDEARAQYERAMELDAARPEAYFNIALIYQDYASGAPPDLLRAKGFYEQFLERAGDNRAYAEIVTRVRQHCRDQEPDARRGLSRRDLRRLERRLSRSSCRPGRIQLIEITIAALEEAERMMAEAEAMQREAEAMQREAEQQQQQQQEQQEPAPEGGQ